MLISGNTKQSPMNFRPPSILIFKAYINLPPLGDHTLCCDFLFPLGPDFLFLLAPRPVLPGSLLSEVPSVSVEAILAAEVGVATLLAEVGGVNSPRAAAFRVLPLVALLLTFIVALLLLIAPLPPPPLLACSCCCPKPLSA